LAVTDDIIHKLIAKNVGNSAAIAAAIENMWHGKNRIIEETLYFGTDYSIMIYAIYNHY
jgi:hypothetical protein